MAEFNESSTGGQDHKATSTSGTYVDRRANVRRDDECRTLLHPVGCRIDETATSVGESLSGPTSAANTRFCQISDPQARSLQMHFS